MKLAVISSHNSQNTQDLERVAMEQNIEIKTYSMRDLAFDVDNILNHDFLSHDVYLFRGYNKNIVVAQSLAQFLSWQGKTVIDKELSGSNYTPSKFFEALKYKYNNIPHIKTYSSGSVDAWKSLDASINYPVVIKDVDSQKGKGVRLCLDEPSLLAEIEQNGFNILVQEYVPMDFDIRVICIDDKVIGAAKRTSMTEDFRTNVSLGGEMTSYELSSEESELAMKAHKCMGYDISGVDIAHDSSGKPFVIETNITPEWQGFKSATGIDVASEILQSIKEKVSK